MARMEMSIDIFRVLKKIADAHGISQVQWAKAAETHQPRISELVVMMEGREPADARLFTLDKFIKLYGGLTKIIGVGTVKEEFVKLIEAEPDKFKRLWAKMGLLMESSDERGIEDLERLFDIMLQKR